MDKIKQLTGCGVLWAEQITICLGIAVGGIWLFITKILKSESGRLWKENSLFFILSLATVSVTSILLHIPNPRYWIAIIPLLFWGPAALISRYSPVCSDKIMICLSVMLSFIFVNPVFTSVLNSSAHKDKDLVLSLREKLSASVRPPVKALGAFPDPLLSFTIPGRWQSTGNMEVGEDSSYEVLVGTKVMDLVIVDDWLTRTQQYKKEQDFFARFTQHPETYGYVNFLSSENKDGPIYIFKKLPQTPGPSRI